MSPAAARRIDAAHLVEDLEQLAVAGAIDDVVVRMVREALLAIADQVRELELNALDPRINRDEVLALVDPERRS